MGIVFRKEFREIFRDRRTLFSVVISPLVVTPALLAALGLVISGQQEKAKKEAFRVGIVGQGQIVEQYKKTPSGGNLRIVVVTRNEAEEQIKSRALRAAIVFPANADELLRANRTVPVELLMDGGNENSRMAAARLEAAFGEASQRVVEERLRAAGMPAELATPFKVTQKPITEGGSMATLMLSMLLPYTLAIAAFGGGIYAANDLVAGEKERGTLETLLVAPASRRDVVIGKFLAVCAVCLVSSMLAVVGLVVPFFSGLKPYEWLAKGGVSLDPVAVIITLAMQIPLAVLFAGILLTLSTFARNQKEAQTYLGPLFLVVLVPAMMTMFVGSEVALSTALVPVMNAALIIKQALGHTYQPAFIALAFAASAVYAALAVLICIRMFQRESVLLKA